MGRWIDALSGLEVKVTGDFRRSSLQMTQKELEQVLASRGALPVGDIRRTTDLLIRAESASWKYGTFGDREAELAEHRARGGRGVVIDVDDLAVLLNGGVVWARDPLAPPEEAPPLGAPYRPAPVVTGVPVSLFERDPGAIERALAGHARTQNDLAEFLERRGILTLSPNQSPIQFDLAWELAGEIWVAEVKSLSEQNEAIQVRLAIGQVIDYAWRLRERHQRSVRKVVALEHPPDDPAWTAICDAGEIMLTWPPFAKLDKLLADLDA